MQGNSSTATRPSTIGDGAVEGLLYGILAGVVMAVFLLAVSLLAYTGTMSIVRTLAVALEVSSASVVLGHFALSALYGLIWGILYRAIFVRATIPAWIWGLFYGAILWGASALLLPNEIDLSPLISAGAHLLFGLCLGVLTPSRTNAGSR